MINDQNYHDIVKKLVLNNEKVSKGSNLQNIPSRGDGVRVRNMFKPRDGWVFVSADLSQIEPRIMAHIMYERYNDNSLRQIFLDDRDLYTTMAMMVFNLDEKYCVDKAYDPTGTFQPRRMMKTGVLAKSYDQKAHRFASGMGVSQDVAEMFYEKFDDTFVSFTTMVQDIREFMKQNGYTETLFGRKRRFPNFKLLEQQVRKNEGKLRGLYIDRARLQKKKVKTSNDERKLHEIEIMIEPLAEKRNEMEYMLRACFNAVIQGSGADVLKKNMIQIFDICKAKGWELNASIHDEVKISMPFTNLTRSHVDLITQAMSDTVKLSVPLKSDTVIEPRWMMEYSSDEWDFESGRPYELKYGESKELYMGSV
ncbi:DNA polymerase [Thermoactinomyces sp. DSM 45892]|uniref:DNA polymerase n=1 Tax=Thermoactinomyces sp. DSM 45892 TaxID=1882753 RepID=UPI00089AB022|nr:DNA polymerase [Thermoactinomyces sp. DSM 45892]SDZ05757.1 DNA polymerase-1 [Thermoactinomyces sp. DSM 45892]